MRALNVLLALLVSLALALLVIEGGLRLLGMGPPRNLLRFDPDLGWSMKPDGVQRKRTGEYEVTLRTNALGLRDDPMDSPAKPAGTFRVLALGDSFVQGWSVDREDLFVDLLERGWRAEGRPVEVVNAGVEGWSTDQQVAWLLREGAAFQPDLVLLFPYENDLYWCAAQQYPPDLDKPRFTPEGELEPRALVDHAGEGWRDDFALTRLLLRRGGPPTFVPEGGERAIPREFAALLREPPGFLAEAEARALGALRALRRHADELGARVLVVPIPSHAAIDPEYARGFGAQVLHLPQERWSADVPVDTFARLGAEAALPVFDPRPALRAAAAEGEPVYFRRDWHLNPLGNRVLARALATELELRGLVPDPTGPPLPPLAASAAARGRPPMWLAIFLVLWVGLSTLYARTYRDERPLAAALQVGALLALVFAIALGGRWLLGLLPPRAASAAVFTFLLTLLAFVAFKLGRRIGTIAELLRAFTLRGHWYLMPLVVVLLSVGSLLVVAASSPLVAPFIYTLF